MNCIPFCEAFELALKGHDETKEKLKEVLRGFVDLAEN